MRATLVTPERLMQSQDMLRLLARGDQEIAAGIGYDLNDVLAEADRLLTEDAV